MTRRRSTVLLLAVVVATIAPCSVNGFSVGQVGQRPAFHGNSFAASEAEIADRTMVLYMAKAKKKVSSASLEALEALEEQFMDSADDGDNSPQLSKKELKEMAKKQKKQASSATADNKDDLLAKALENEAAMEASADNDQHVNGSDQNNNKKLSKKEQMLAKALALEALDSGEEESPYKEEKPKLSKKELKELIKKEQKQKEKEEKKRKKKEEKMQQKQQQEAVVDGDDSEGESPSPLDATEPEIAAVPVEAAAEEAPAESTSKPTLEEKIRKERSPPRIRVMESTQPGYTSLRLEGIGITFRNQQVLNEVTWGVQTGDRIGLVGANGAGKTTQLRIMAGELEPTVGDVVKSSQSLRVAMLRQEFVDELVLTRTLREEMLSVFDEENQILQDLKDTEHALAQMDTMDESAEAQEKMQEILDRMQELQNEAENKEVYVLESRVQKVMDLMGFTDDEADDLVASFSGGWKMRIGLGKVLLKDPNILLLDEPTNHLVRICSERPVPRLFDIELSLLCSFV